jgi:hypothetical protein
LLIFWKSLLNFWHQKIEKQIHSCEPYSAVARKTISAVSSSVLFLTKFPLSNKKLGNLCFPQAMSTNFIATFSSLEISKKIKTWLRMTRQETEERRNVASRRADCVFHLPKRWLLDTAFCLAQQAIAFCLGTSVPATRRTFGFSFLFRHFSSLRPLSVNSFFALDCHTRCGACFGDVTIAVAYCKPPCTIHIGWEFVEVWRGPVCLAVLDQCFPSEVIIEPVVEIHAASLNCTVQCGVESTEDQSCVSRCCVVISASGTSTEKSHGRCIAKFDSFQYRVDSSQLSAFSSFAINFRLWLL